MAEQLSDPQIDPLFAAGREGRRSSGADAARHASARVSAVDFSRPSKFTKEQERQLRRAHETFCRTASTGLGADIRTPIDLEVIGIAQLNWSNAVLEVGQDSVCAVVDINPLGTHLVMTLERVFALTLIERLCGGSLTGVAADRSLTDIDVAITSRIFQLFVEQLSLVWHEFAGVHLSFAQLELDASAAQVAALSEPTLMLTLEVRLGKGAFGLGILLPYSATELATGRFTSGAPEGPANDPAARTAMHRAIHSVGIELRAEVAAVELTAERILALSEGDLVRLGPASSGVTLFADDVPLQRAKPGRDGARRAVQLVGETLS